MLALTGILLVLVVMTVGQGVVSALFTKLKRKTLQAIATARDGLPSLVCPELSSEGLWTSKDQRSSSH